jgi:hypothetical protein
MCYIDNEVKAAQCKIYQLATQSLCSDVRLHSRIQGGRHERNNVMEYKRVGEEVEVESEDEDELVNKDAYEMEGREDVGLVTDEEQGGVVHLVHGWVQQNQPSKVSDCGD